MARSACVCEAPSKGVLPPGTCREADVDVSSLGACARPQIGVAETGNKGKVPHARHEVQSLEKNQFGN